MKRLNRIVVRSLVQVVNLLSLPRYGLPLSNPCGLGHGTWIFKPQCFHMQSGDNCVYIKDYFLWKWNGIMHAWHLTTALKTTAIIFQTIVIGPLVLIRQVQLKPGVRESWWNSLDLNGWERDMFSKNRNTRGVYWEPYAP